MAFLSHSNVPDSPGLGGVVNNFPWRCHLRDRTGSTGDQLARHSRRTPARTVEVNRVRRFSSSSIPSNSHFGFDMFLFGSGKQ